MKDKIVLYFAGGGMAGVFGAGVVIALHPIKASIFNFYVNRQKLLKTYEIEQKEAGKILEFLGN